MDNLNERDWRRLTEAISRGNCVLLTGPDVEFLTDGSSVPPLSSRLAQKLAAPLSSDFPTLKEDLAHIAQLRYNKDGDRSDIEFEVEEFYRPFERQTLAVHRSLAGLPFTLCLGTTPADFMASAFREAGKKPISDFYHFRKPRLTELSESDAKHPIVYNLFGSLDALDSLVLTETDLLEFLVNVVRGAPALHAYIAGQLADPQTSFLFLGFGFQRWYTRVLLHVLQTYGHRNRSLALEAASFFEHPDHKHTAMFFEKEHKIEFRQHSWTQFASELRGRFDPQIRTQPRPELPTTAPKAFLCHDSRDRDLVIKVEENLQALGVDTWRDRQDLRGGDDWDRRIEQVLREQVDYVVALQTPNLIERPESYVHKEIGEALERQKRFDEGERFLIPTILVRCAGLNRLSHLNCTDISTPQGLERLAQEILADWVKRKSRLKDTGRERS